MIGNELTHATLFWLLTGALAFCLSLIGVLFKWVWDMRKNLAEAITTKKEVAQINLSLQAIASRLDSLYNILAQKALGGK